MSMFWCTKYNGYINLLMVLLIMVELPMGDGLYTDSMTFSSKNLKNKYNYWKTPGGGSGDLYSRFKVRLERIQEELSYPKLYDDQMQIESKAKSMDKENCYVQHINRRQGSFYNWLQKENSKIGNDESKNNIEQIKINESILIHKNFPNYKYNQNDNPFHLLTKRLQYKPSRITKFHPTQHRREIGNYTTTSENSSLHPSILTKALEISLNPATNTQCTGNFLSNVAQQMNTSAMGLAQELTKPLNMSAATLNDDMNLRKIFNNYTSNNDFNKKMAFTRDATAKDKLPHKYSSLPEPASRNNNKELTNVTASNLRDILDKVLYKLEQIHKDRYENQQEELPDGLMKLL